MLYPKLNRISQDSESITVFKGLNRNLRVTEGEFEYTQNMSADYYPLMSPRKARGLVRSVDSVSGMCAKDNVYYCSGEKLYYLEGTTAKEVTGVTVSADSRHCPKRMLSMGAYLLIFPDNVYVNTAKEDDKGDIYTCVRISDISRYEIVLYLNNGDGTVSLIQSNSLAIGTNKPTEDEMFESTDYEHGARRYFLDISVQPAKLWYSDGHKESSMWVEKEYSVGIKLIPKQVLSPVYFKRVKNGQHWEMTGTDAVWGEMEARTVSVIGASGEETDYTYLILDTELYLKTEETVLYKYYVNFVPQWTDALWITTNDEDEGGIVNKYGESNSFLKASYRCKADMSVRNNEMPKFDRIVESNNRLWACRYGADRDGNTVNEIYASALGDFRSWDDYDGISTDSYRVSLGSDGAFTGAVNYGGNPVFFKENSIHRVYGSYPAEYQLVTDVASGVAEGSERSISFVGGAYIYRARDGFKVYDGSVSDIGYALANAKMTVYGSGSADGRYYCSVWEQDGGYSMLVYDTVSTLWMREDETVFINSADYKGDTLIYDETDNAIKSLRGTIGTALEGFQWSCETGILGVTEDVARYLVRLDIRSKSAVGSIMRVYVKYDDEDDWTQVGAISHCDTKNFALPIRVRRCQHIRLRFEGRGDCKVQSIYLISERGNKV